MSLARIHLCYCYCYIWLMPILFSRIYNTSTNTAVFTCQSRSSHHHLYHRAHSSPHQSGWETNRSVDEVQDETVISHGGPHMVDIGQKTLVLAMRMFFHAHGNAEDPHVLLRIFLFRHSDVHADHVDFSAHAWPTLENTPKCAIARWLVYTAFTCSVVWMFLTVVKNGSIMWKPRIGIISGKMSIKNQVSNQVLPSLRA